MIQTLKQGNFNMELDISLNESIPLSNGSDDEFGISYVDFKMIFVLFIISNFYYFYYF